MPTTWSQFAAMATTCRTMADWNHLASITPSHQLVSPSRTAVSQIFRQLCADPCSKRFSFQIWSLLAEGALVASDHGLSSEILRYCYKFAPVAFLVEHAFHLGEALGTAEISSFLKKRQRLRNNSDLDRINLRLALAVSQLSAKQPNFAVRGIEIADQLLAHKDISIADRARATAWTATCHYCLGQNIEASLRYEQAASLWATVGNYYQQCRCLYNAAANSPMGEGDPARTLELLASAGDLARKHQFSSVMLMCLSFEAVTLSNQGRFEKSNECIHAALQLAPSMHFESRMGLHTLHISNLVGMKLWLKAERALQQVKARFPGVIQEGRLPHIVADEATILEQRGHIQDALLYLREHLEKRGHTTHTYRKNEWRTIELVYVNLCLNLGVEIDNLVDWRAWLDHFEKISDFSIFSTLARILVDQGRIGEASSIIDAVRKRADITPCFKNDCEVVRGELLLRQGVKTSEYAKWLARFSAALTPDEETRLTPFLCLFRAVLAYRTGDLTQVRRALTQMRKSRFTTFLQRFCADCWIRHMSGQSVRLPHRQPWKHKALARATKIYFKPILTADFETRHMKIGEFSVDLGDKPLLSVLLRQIFSLRHEGLPRHEFYRRVWGSNFRIVAWDERLRKALSRLRQQLSATVAPLFYTEGSSIHMLADCFDMTTTFSQQSTTVPTRLLSLLQAGVWSANEMARMTKMSRATMKRHLTKLVASGRVQRVRYGRRVVYRIEAEELISSVEPLEDDLRYKS